MTPPFLFFFSGPTAFGLVFSVTCLALVTAGNALAQPPQHNPTDLRFADLPLCYPSTVVRHYVLDPTPSCRHISASATKSFTADIFPPQPSLLDIPAHRCTLETVKVEATAYFFGAKTVTTTSPSYTSVSALRCRTWLLQQRDTQLGPLAPRPDQPMYFTTNHVAEPTFSWPWTTYSSVINAHISATTLTFNSRTQQAQHLLDPVLDCDLTAGTCLSATAVYLFRPFNLTCHITNDNSISRNTPIFVHQTNEAVLFQAPTIDLAFSKVTTCPDFITKCYSGYAVVRCTTTHFVLASDQVTAKLLDTKPLAEKIDKVVEPFDPSTDAFALTISQAFSSLALNIDAAIFHLRDEVLRLQCTNSKVQLANLQATQLINPSAALSALLGRPAFATKGTATLQEISCVRVAAVLQPSLWVNGRLASEPIFTIHHGNHTRQAQWTPGKYLRLGLSSFTNPVNDSQMLFNVDNRLFAFHNGTLAEDKTPLVHTVGLGYSSVTLQHTTVDTAALTKTFHSATSGVGLEKVQQSLQALMDLSRTHLAAAGINKLDLDNFLDQPGSSKEQKHFLSTVHSLFKSPWDWVATVAKWLSIAWGSIITISLGYAFLCYIVRCTRRRTAVEKVPPRPSTEDAKTLPALLPGNNL